jgi:hypothetical protein
MYECFILALGVTEPDLSVHPVTLTSSETLLHLSVDDAQKLCSPCFYAPFLHFENFEDP